MDKFFDQTVDLVPLGKQWEMGLIHLHAWTQYFPGQTISIICYYELKTEGKRKKEEKEQWSVGI
jgi:hypothetical protein